MRNISVFAHDPKPEEINCHGSKSKSLGGKVYWLVIDELHITFSDPAALQVLADKADELCTMMRQDLRGGDPTPASQDESPC